MHGAISIGLHNNDAVCISTLLLFGGKIFLTLLGEFLSTVQRSQTVVHSSAVVMAG